MILKKSHVSGDTVCSILHNADSVGNIIKKILDTIRGIVNILRPSDAFMRRWSNNCWFILWLVAWSAPSHHMIHYWNVVNWTLRYQIKWNCTRNSYICSKITFVTLVCGMVAILFQPHCVKLYDSKVSSKWKATTKRTWKIMTKDK